MADAFVLLTTFTAIFTIFKLSSDYHQDKLRINLRFPQILLFGILGAFIAEPKLSIILFFYPVFEPYYWQLIFSFIFIGLFSYYLPRKRFSMRSWLSVKNLIIKYIFSKKSAALVSLFEDELKYVFQDWKKGKTNSLREQIIPYLMNDNLIKAIIQVKPNFLLKLFLNEKVPLECKQSISNFFFNALINDKNSIFYQEFKTIYRREKKPYRITKDEPLFAAITDTPFIEKYTPGTHITNAILEYIDNNKEYYLRDHPGWIEREKDLSDPIYTVIRYFSILIEKVVFASLSAGHTHLAYLTDIYDEICNLIEKKSADSSLFASILDEIFFSLIKPIDLYFSNPEKCEDPFHEYFDFIPQYDRKFLLKAAMHLLSVAYRRLIFSKNDRSYPQIFHRLMRLYSSDNMTFRKYAEYMLICFLEAKGDKNFEMYHKTLIEDFNNFRTLSSAITEYGESSLDEILNRIHGNPPEKGYLNPEVEKVFKLRIHIH